MSSAISKIARNKGTGKARKVGRLNSRGATPGPAQTLKRSQYDGLRKPGLSKLGKQHNLKRADPKCLTCKGSGVVLANYAVAGKALQLACRCVPEKEKADA